MEEFWSRTSTSSSSKTWTCKFLQQIRCVYQYLYYYILYFPHRAPDIYNDFYNLLYYPTHIRAQSYFIGMILGYLLTRYEKNGKCDVEGKVWRLFDFSYDLIFVLFFSFQSKICEAIMWLLASTLVTGLFGINIIYYIMQRNLIMNSFFMGNVRLEWAISVSSLILLCHTGKAKIINQILSSRYWMPLAKMGLSIYLIHPVLQYNIQSPREFITNFDFSHMISNYFCDVLLTVLVSLILYLLVEEPFTLLGKIISNKLFDIDSTKNFIVLIEMKINKFLRKHWKKWSFNLLLLTRLTQFDECWINVMTITFFGNHKSYRKECFTSNQ